MKAIKKCISFITAMVSGLCGACLIGCNQDASNAFEGELLLSFENVKEVQSMTVYRGINKAEMNKDKKFITEGERSFRLCPKASPVDGQYESSYIAFLGGGKYFSKTNFEDVAYLSVDFYNPTEYAYSLVWGVRGNDSDSYTVKSGWNTLYKYIDREMLYANNQGFVELISFYFEGRSEAEGALDVYMDNVRYYSTDEAYEKLTVAKKEVIGFESGVERNIFEVQKKSGDASAECILSINNDLVYVKTGTRSLKITAGANALIIPDKPVLKVLGSNLPDLNEYLNDGWFFTMPIYNGGAQTVSCSLLFSSALEEYHYAFEIAPHSWAKESEKISMDTIKAQFAGEGLDIQSITVKFEGLQATESVYIDRIGVIK